MTYQETLHWMFAQLPMYQRQGKTAFKKDLSNTVALAKHLKHPEHSFKSVHVAGTNGKGSTSHMIASILQEAGYKVGLYTSPHLKDFRERIRINGTPVSKQYVIGFIKNNKTFLEANSLSFFEMTVGMAFAYFSKQRVDIAVVEVGLGGRLDSTNILMPEVSVITNIGLDHTQFLGNTLDLIAREKGGIIKPKIPVVIGETHPETEPVFDALSKTANAPIVYADKVVDTYYTSDLVGSYQTKNIKTTVQAIHTLLSKGYHILEKDIQAGFLNVTRNTGLLGRWQVLNEQPKVVCDTGHNREGLTYVMSQLKQEVYSSLHIVFGVVKDKDLSTIADLLPKAATYYFCKPNISRGLEAEVLRDALAAYNLIGNTYASVNEAYKKALENADSSDFIFVGGSTFVVAEII